MFQSDLVHWQGPSLVGAALCLYLELVAYTRMHPWCTLGESPAGATKTEMAPQGCHPSPPSRVEEHSSCACCVLCSHRG